MLYLAQMWRNTKIVATVEREIGEGMYNIIDIETGEEWTDVCEYMITPINSLSQKGIVTRLGSEEENFETMSENSCYLCFYGSIKRCLEFCKNNDNGNWYKIVPLPEENAEVSSLIYES